LKFGQNEKFKKSVTAPRAILSVKFAAPPPKINPAPIFSAREISGRRAKKNNPVKKITPKKICQKKGSGIENATPGFFAISKEKNGAIEIGKTRNFSAINFVAKSKTKTAAASEKNFLKFQEICENFTRFNFPPK
jgi:hypothetical protein